MNDTENKWVCRVIVYSGLKDPEWIITDENAMKIVGFYDSSDLSSADKHDTKQFGYRGCLLMCSDGRSWFAFDGIIEYRNKGINEFRIDKNRDFERGIIMTAPYNIQALIYRQQ
ncbi:MAG: hypothetical protein PHN88_12220 [Ignavibacteria bacterium]|nr:hypothetical protein [Ignavibacteria bacterium]